MNTPYQDHFARSVRARARIAGASYMILIVGGVFVQAGVFQRLLVAGDASATMGLITANAPLWRLGLAVNLLYLLANVPVATILYGFFRQQYPTVARCALGLVVISTGIEGLALVLLYAPLALSDASPSLAAFSEAQRYALAYQAIRLHSVSFGFALMFFAGFCALTGVLIIRSRLVPRVIGLMMVIAGGFYAANTLLMLLAPATWHAVSPAILIPCLLGELALAAWLLIRGATSADIGASALSGSKP